MAVTPATTSLSPSTVMEATPTGPVPQITQLPTPMPAPATNATLPSLPAGLIYQTLPNFLDPNPTLPAYWRMGNAGTAIKIADQTEMALPLPFVQPVSFSSDGARMLLSKSDGANDTEVWLLDTATGEQKQLTNDPDRNNSYPRWWPGNANTLIFMSSGKKDMERPGMFPRGSLGMVNADGSGYKVYEDIDYYRAMPSPDGKTMLHSNFTSLSWFTLDGQSGAIDPAQYPNFKLAEPNPDAQVCPPQNVVLGVGNGSPDASIFVWGLCMNELTFINLQDPAKTFSITRSFSAMPTPSTVLPAWSSDSQYFALASSNLDGMNLAKMMPNTPVGSAVHIFSRNGALVHQLDLAGDIVTALYWRPGAPEFLYTTLPLAATGMIPPPPPPPGATPLPPGNPASQSKAFLFNVDTHALVEINLPSPISVLGWVSVP